MGKYGKKTSVSSDLSKYKIGVMGVSGFGKSTLMFNACQKLFGDEGYIILDMGNENGLNAIVGATAEHVPNFQTFYDIVDDICTNKDIEYPNLKVVIIDTLDAFFDVVEQYIIQVWNREHQGDANFKKALTINPVEGGFGHGLDRVIETAQRLISKLNAAGVGVWWTAHVKEREQTDAVSGNTYTNLTANMTNRYFNAIKNSTDVIGFGFYDRSIEKIEVGDENPVTKKKKTRNLISSEARRIRFRDDSYVMDAKSRFKYIVPEIKLDADEFIKAIKDAIVAQQNEGLENDMKATTKAPAAAPKAEPVIETTEDLEEVIFDIDEAKEEIKNRFGELTKEEKAEILSSLNGTPFAQANAEQVKGILKLLNK